MGVVGRLAVGAARIFWWGSMPARWGGKRVVYFGQALGLVLVLVGAFVLNLKT